MSEKNTLLELEQNKKNQLFDKPINKENVCIEVAITNKCNCNCSYCFENDHSCSNIDEKIQNRQLELIEKYCQSFDINKHSYLVIDFWGGEPTLNMNFIESIIDRTIKYPFVRYHMYTNGILFSNFFRIIRNKNIDILRNRIQIQLSYDGEPHNTIKRGKFKDQIFKTFNLLKENGIHASFKATLSYDMIKHLPDIWKSYEEASKKFGIGYVLYHPTLDTNVNDSNIKYFSDWKKSLKTIAKYELEYIKKNGINLMSWFNEVNDKATCGLNGKIHLDIDGNIYPCHGCPYSKNKNDFYIDNINQIERLDELIDRNVENSKKNTKCYYCGATFCNQCHVTQVNSKEYEKTWLSSLGKDKVRCLFFKYFGKIKNAYDMALINQRVNKINI